MGSCLGKGAVSVEDKKKSEQIDSENAEDYRKEQEKVKLLLLGPGESGKSTIFRQIKLLHGTQSEEDKRLMKPTVHQNIIASIKVLLEQADKRGVINRIQAQDVIQILKYAEDNATIDTKIGNAIHRIWNDPIIQNIWENRSKFQIMESANYFFDEISRISTSDYIPNKNDLLFTRVRTTGIITDKYMIDGTPFEIYDVGGQRNERKKWIHCFDGVTAVLFVSSISEYDQMLFEDNETNRVTEALTLFKETCSNTFFQNSNIILFLNKRDLFEEKIMKVDLCSLPFYQDYKGPSKDIEAGIKYFKEKFLSNKGSFSKDIYVHVVCATDTENVRRVFDACKKSIIKASLTNSGY